MSRFVARCGLVGAALLGALLPYNFAAAASDTIVYSFRGYGANDGFEPGGALLADAAGNLYGTTESGGDYARHCRGGCGTVFKLAPDGTETVLYAFPSSTSAAIPLGTLARDKDGTLYGVALTGGSGGWGIVYAVAPDGTPRVLQNFANDGGGFRPLGGLLLHDGNLFGTTQFGGGANGNYSNCGIVYELGRDGSNFSTLHAFAGGSDGCSPQSELIVDKSGNLYGTTYYGGGSGCTYSTGCGTVFRIAPDGKETMLHAFLPGTNDGLNPNGAVVQDDAGNLYGTTVGGGANQFGTVFEVAADGTETVLHSFEGGRSDGAEPYSKLLRTRSGDLYGTTFYGGPHDNGTVFRVSAGGNESVLYAFTATRDGDGEFPLAGLVAGTGGYLYGTTLRGGTGTVCNGKSAQGCGTVFRIHK